MMNKTDRKATGVRMLLCLCLIAPGAVRADSAIKDAMASIPADAMGCFCIPNLKQLDASYQQAIAALGLQPFVPPPANSLVSMIKMNLPFGESLDENGPMAFVIMPATNPFELPMKLAFLLSVKEPKALLEKMGATLGENGVYSVTVFGQSSFATIKGSQLVVARMPDVAKAIADSKEGLHTKLSSSELKMLDGLDALLWVGTDRLLPLVRPQIESMMDMMAMMQAGSNPLAMKQAKLNKKQLGMFFDGLASLGIGISLDGSGLNLRFAATTKPGTDLHAKMKVRNTTETLLRSLPGGDYMFAFGETTDPAQLKAGVESLDDYISLAQEIEGLDKEQINKLKQKLQAWIPLNTGLRASLQAFAPNANGVFRATAIFDTTDSASWFEQANASFELIKSIFMDQKVADLGSEVMSAAKATTFTAKAEKIGDTDIAHLKIDLTKIESIDEEVIEDIQSVIGQDGAMIRLAAADAKTVVMTFGGGSDHFEKALTLAKSGDSPLDADPGIQKISQKLPKNRYLVGYVAVDQLFAGMRHVMTAMDEDPLPIHFPPLKSPLGLCGTGGEGWSQFDIFVPIEVLSATKDAAMAFMGTQGAVTPVQPSPAENSDNK